MQAAHTGALAARLESDGYDKATSKTLIETANSQNLEDAQTLLSGLIGADAPELKQYIAGRRQPVMPVQRNFVANRPYELPLGGPGTVQRSTAEAKKPKISNQEKADAIKDLDAALHRLDLGLAASKDRKACTCMGSKHGLLEIAPNCLNCGRIVCNEEGLGPCLTCGEALVSSEVISRIYDILSEQRASVASTMGRKALAAAGIDPTSKPDTGIAESAARAQERLERLLGYQDTGEQRTRIIDQVGDFDTPDSGLSMWMTPAEQALQLRRQQRQLRRQEDIRKQKTGRGRKVISIDIRGNKVYQTEEDVTDLSDNDSPLEEMESEQAGKSVEEASLYYDAKSFNRRLARPKYPSRAHESIKKEKELNPPQALNVVYNEDEVFTY